MHIQSILNLFNSKSHWTFENFSSSVGGIIYDEYGEGELLSDGNTTSGNSGNANTKLSVRSSNLNGGFFSCNIPSFYDNDIGNRNFVISIAFKTDGTQITGPKALLSKWSPQQQFWIGFDGGNLVARVDTVSGGIDELVFTNKDIIYNTEYFNQITLEITPNHTRFYLNGAYIESNDIANIPVSPTTEFVVGEELAPFTSNVYINDLIAVATDVEDLPMALWRLPRGNTECIQAQNPKYLFDLEEAGLTYNGYPIPNKGSVTCDGYLTSLDGGEYSMSRPDQNFIRQAASFNSGSFFTIDDDLDIRFETGVTFLTIGKFDYPLNGGSNFANTLIDIKENGINNAWRLKMAPADNGANEWLAYEAYNSAATLISTQSEEDQNFSNYSGLGLLAIQMTNGSVKTTFGDLWDASEYQYQNETFNLTAYQPLTIAYNRFFLNNGTQGVSTSDIMDFAIFDYKLNDNQLPAMKYNRAKLKRDLFVKTFNSGSASDYVYWTGTNITGYESLSEDMGTISSTMSYTPAIEDALGNRTNEFTYGAYSSTIDQYFAYDGEASGENHSFNQNDFTISFFVLNNSTDLQQLIFEGTAGVTGPYIYINSFEGNFAHGWIEMIADPTDATNDAQRVISGSDAIKETGFHMVTFIRRGLWLECWIDGKLSGSKLTDTVSDLVRGDPDNQFIIYGKDQYYSDVFISKNYALTQAEIEFLFEGYADVVKGQCIYDNDPLVANVYSINHQTGEKLGETQTDGNGRFALQLRKDIFNKEIDVVAVSDDPSITRHVVVHGPYTSKGVYTYLNTAIEAQDYDAMILDMEPVAYYKLDQDTGTQADDSSGNDLHGTFTGGFTLDQPAMSSEFKSVSFDGLDGHVDLPDGFDDFTDGMTLEAWVKFEAFNTWSRIIELASGAEGVDSIFFSNAITNPHIAIETNGAGSRQIENDVLKLDVWQHLVARQSREGTTSIWVDGIKVHEATSQAQPTNVTRTLNYIGKSTYSADDYFEGSMSNVAIYDHPLSDEDIIKHTYRGLYKKYATYEGFIENDSPIDWWRFNRTTLLNDYDEDTNFTSTGSYVIKKNSLVLHDTAVDNSYLDAGSYSLNQNSWSIEFSVKSDSATIQADATILAQWDQATTAGVYKIAFTSNNDIAVYYNAEANVLSSDSRTNPIDHNDQEWHHVVLTYDGTDLLLYVDGSSDSVSATHTMTYPDHNLMIGTTSDNDQTWNLEQRTLIDDLAIYDYTLNSTQIDQHYDKFVTAKSGT